MLLGTLGASFLGNILTCKGINRAGEGHGQEIVCTGYGSNSRESKKKKKILLPVHSLTNIEMKMYYQNEARFINVYSRDNLPN